MMVIALLTPLSLNLHESVPIRLTRYDMTVVDDEVSRSVDSLVYPARY